MHSIWHSNISREQDCIRDLTNRQPCLHYLDETQIHARGTEALHQACVLTPGMCAEWQGITPINESMLHL